MNTNKDDVNNNGGGSRILLIACTVVFIDSLGYGVVVPLFPHYSRALGAGDFALGFLYATYSIALLVSSIPFGIFSDKLGRKPFILFGMFAMSASFIFYALADNYLLLIVARLLDGFTAAATWSAAMALAGDSFPDNVLGEKLGYLMSAMAAGSIAGPLLGGIVADLAGFRAPFFCIAGLCIAGGCAALFLGSEERRTGGEDAGWRTLLGPVLRNKTIMLACFLEMTVTIGLGILEPMLPVRLEKSFSMSSSTIGLVFGATMLAFAIANPIFGWASDRVGRRGLIVFGLLFTAVIIPLVVFAGSVTWVFITMSLLGIAYAVYTASATPLTTDALAVADTGSDRPHGTAFGVLNLSWSMGMALGPLLGGALTGEIGLLWTMIIYSGVLVLSAIPVLVILQKKQK